jgi:uncharacterized membrane protein YedE/YeeE
MESEIEVQARPDVDYRWLRYSKFALPWLILMLAFFVTLLLLTFWYGGFTIKRIRDGVPRDLEPGAKADEGDGGQLRPVRNLRLATGIVAFVAGMIIVLAYYLSLGVKAMRGACFFVAFLLIVAAIMAVIVFALDVGRSENIRKCWTEPTVDGFPSTVVFCESRAAYGYACTALDAVLFALCVGLALMLIKWGKYFRRSRSGWYREDMDLSGVDDDLAAQEGLAVLVPGQAHVYKMLVGIVIFFVLITAALLIIFSILIHEFRERFRSEEAGWPRENTRLRLASCIIGILLVLFSLVPYPHRVFHYLIAFLFFIDAVMFFVIFALDVNDLHTARDLPCFDDNGLYCIYHPYNTIVVFDILCGILIIIYIVVEFIIHKKRGMVAAREYAYNDDVGIDEFGLAPRMPGEAVKSLSPIPVPLAPMRPVIGVEVLEVQDIDGVIRLTVSGVTPGSAADEAGLRLGDIITRWDDFPIHTKADFARAVSDAHIGSTALLQVERRPPTGLGGYATSAFDILRLTIRGVPI